jgi:hypothetical protein
MRQWELEFGRPSHQAVEGNALTVDEQRAKLRLVVEVAREVWG